jgi:hypothetical protein
VMPVARKLWQPSRVRSPAFLARFFQISRACVLISSRARGAEIRSFSRLIDIVVHVTLVPNRLRIRAAPSIL